MTPFKAWKAAAVMASAPASEGERYWEPFERGAVSLGLYAPRSEDLQQPHDRDELYFVISGRGEFEHGEESASFEPGDVLFVAAGHSHRFVNFSADLSTWVVFWPAAGSPPRD